MPRKEYSECHWIPGPFLPSVRHISEAISYRLARKGESSDGVPSQGKFAELTRHNGEVAFSWPDLVLVIILFLVTLAQQ
jgi:hypothetical protein